MTDAARASLVPREDGPAVDWLRRLAKPSLGASPPELATLRRAVESAKAVLRWRVKDDVFFRIGSAPLLLSYSAGGAPMRAGKCRRTARGTEEYYIQQAWYIHYGPGGLLRSSVMLADPLPLKSGKKVPWLWSCTLQFVRWPRPAGHKSVVVHHYAVDRGIYTGMVRALKRWHLHVARERPASSDQDRKLLHLLNWIVSTPCALHTVHLGVSLANGS